MSERPETQTGHGSWPRELTTRVLPDVQVANEVPGPFAILSESVFVSSPLEFEPHEHPLHELVWVRGGTMTVRLAESIVTVPDGYALRIPAGTLHSGRTTAKTTLFDALFDPARSPVGFTDPMTIEVTPVLASLLAYLEGTELSDDARLRAEAVVFDVLAPAEQQLSLRVPHVERLAPIVTALLADPSDDRPLEDWAKLAGVSERTVSRLFRTHTGLSVTQWRQVLRVHHALALLTEGRTVQEVSELTGYAQASTFIASFKRVMGTTPGALIGASPAGRP